MTPSPRHHIPIRRSGCGHRGGDHPVQATPSPPGIPGHFTPDREVCPRGPRRPSICRQQLHSQACQGVGLAGSTSRFHVHYTSNYDYWLNQVKFWLGIIMQRAIRQGSFSSVIDLITQIQHTTRIGQRSTGPQRRPQYWRNWSYFVGKSPGPHTRVGIYCEILLRITSLSG